MPVLSELMAPEMFGDPPAHEAPQQQPSSGSTRAAGDIAVARIAAEDLRLLVEKVTTKTIPRSPDALKDEQAGSEKLVEQAGIPAGEGSAYKAPGAAPELARPVLMIPGLTMDASSFDPMSQQLASNPMNGDFVVYVAKTGQFHKGGVNGAVVSGQALQNTRLFQIQYSNDNGAPSDKAPQISAAMSAIQAATGAGVVDVVTHSAGGTDFRLYLQSRKEGSGPDIGNAVLIGPASHGTFMGNVGAKAGGLIGVKKAGSELSMDSPLVKMLNQNWDHQRGQVRGHVTVIAVGGAPTWGQKSAADPKKAGLSDGDGFMPVNEASMPDAQTIVLHGLDPTAVAHLREVEYYGVIGAVEEALRSELITPKL
jgi:uncharacterized alpha/beta hydrolase family protein